ncbi:MAG: biopolymer transporter ExbD [Bacteroidales bacterium]|nr:biopolymer transporter ExbD [Bacteroidales bacterium]
MKLLERNRALFKKIDDFRQQVLTGKLQISPDSARASIAQLKKDDDTGPIVLIKAYKKATYGNFVDILDEMNICGIARYTFVPIAWYEEKMVEMTTGITPSATDSTK